MTRVYLVRHGRAAAGWDTDPDPGLDALGVQQAADMTALLAPLGPLAVVASPLRRCQETAAPLATAWGTLVRTEPAVAEIPSPEGVPMSARVEWLRAALDETWEALGPPYPAFRDSVIAAVCALPSDTVVCSHFVAINAVIGAAMGDDRLVIRSVDNCSITIVDVVRDGDDVSLQLVEGGHEADTLIR
jgi:broad specificity phosphatase PhoE